MVSNECLLCGGVLFWVIDFIDFFVGLASYKFYFLTWKGLHRIWPLSCMSTGGHSQAILVRPDEEFSICCFTTLARRELLNLVTGVYMIFTTVFVSLYKRYLCVMLYKNQFAMWFNWKEEEDNGFGEEKISIWSSYMEKKNRKTNIKN